MSDKGKNKGEWSEIYVFFKLMSDRKVYAADKNMKKLNDVFLNIISIIREENKGKKYHYYTGDKVRITLNGDEVAIVDSDLFADYTNTVWEMIRTNKATTFTDADIRKFLSSIFIEKITSPAQKKSDHFGGTADITLDAVDYRSGVNQIMSFSCKSDIDAASTLFNASADNTNFEYEIVGDFDDEKMSKFNSFFNERTKNGEKKNEVATGVRMEYLKSLGCNLKFINPVKDTAKHNLIRCGGREMPIIVGEMLKYYYFERNASITGVEEAIRHLAECDIADYCFDNLYDTYRVKIANLLFSMFTGFRFSKPWSGRSDVSGGYIVVKRDGDIVAFHSCIADEFKDFLIEKLKFEGPSCTRHKYMQIYKSDKGKYLLKLALQFRFILKNNEK